MFGGYNLLYSSCSDLLQLLKLLNYAFFFFFFLQIHLFKPARAAVDRNINETSILKLV